MDQAFQQGDCLVEEVVGLVICWEGEEGELREVEEGQMRVVGVGPHGHVGVYCLAKEGEAERHYVSVD